MYSMGDPGLFDFVGKAIKGVAGLVGGAVKVGVGAAKGFATGGPLGAVSGGLSTLVRQPNIAPPMIPLQQPGFQPGTGIQIGTGGAGIRIGHFGPGSGMTLPTGGSTGGQLVEQGRKRRRMNPLNPRALSRAVRRLQSAKRASGLINRISIRSKGCGKKCR